LILSWCCCKRKYKIFEEKKKTLKTIDIEDCPETRNPDASMNRSISDSSRSQMLIPDNYKDPALGLPKLRTSIERLNEIVQEIEFTNLNEDNQKEITVDD
jgi:hypothetical protein